jgi:L-aspartate oxidase
MCRALGLDPVSEPIPVAPGAHYSCGGIAAGLDGRTSVPGLLAVGEAASTGVHGANRLASNSLTEALLTGRRAGDRLGRELPEPVRGLLLPQPGPGASAAERPALALEMSRVGGVLRDRDGLERLAGRLAQVPPGQENTLAMAEATSLHVTATLVTAAALGRAESRGAHRWRDQPATSDDQAVHSVLRVRHGQVVTAGTALAGAGGRP